MCKIEKTLFETRIPTEFNFISASRMIKKYRRFIVLTESDGSISKYRLVKSPVKETPKKETRVASAMKKNVAKKPKVKKNQTVNDGASVPKFKQCKVVLKRLSKADISKENAKLQQKRQKKVVNSIPSNQVATVPFDRHDEIAALAEMFSRQWCTIIQEPSWYAIAIAKNRREAETMQFVAVNNELVHLLADQNASFFVNYNWFQQIWNLYLAFEYANTFELAGDRITEIREDDATFQQTDQSNQVAVYNAGDLSLNESTSSWDDSTGSISPNTLDAALFSLYHKELTPKNDNEKNIVRKLF